MAGSDRALCVIDMVDTRIYGTGSDVVSGAHECVRFVQGELRYFRERGRPVIFAVTQRRDGQAPTIISDLTPRNGERTLTKSTPSAFFGTPLGEILETERVGQLTVVGVRAATEVMLTAADAIARGLRVVIPEPCVADPNPQHARLALSLIRDVWSAGDDDDASPPRVLRPPSKSAREAHDGSSA